MKQDDKTFLQLVERFKSDQKLTEADLNIMERWKFVHDSQINSFLVGKDLEQALIDKFDISIRTARYDIANSKKFFITEEMIDKDYWRGLLLRWQLKGLKLSFDNNNFKEFNTGIRNLYMILGLGKGDKNVNPKMLRQNVFNFYSDPKRIGLEEITEAEIIELVDEITAEEKLTPEQKAKILRDAGVQPNS